MNHRHKKRKEGWSIQETELHVLTVKGKDKDYLGASPVYAMAGALESNACIVLEIESIQSSL